MYVLCRSSVGRRVPLLVPFYRFNSTSAPEEPVPSPPKPSSARIASSWGDIVIPSREEILSKNEVASYKPDLSYLASEESSGFAGRLAAKLASSPTANASKQSHGSQISSLDIYESSKEKTSRLQAMTAARRTERQAREHAATQLREAAEAAKAAERAAILAARRTEREAREHAAAQLREAAEAAKAVERAARTAASEKAVFLAEQRRADRLRREAGLTPHQLAAHNASLGLRREAGMTPRPRLAHDASLPVTSPEPRRHDDASLIGVRTKPRFSRVKTHRSSRPSRVSRKSSQDDDLSKDDLLKLLEDGGDEPEPPEFTVPDVSFTDFGNLFRPSFEQSVETMIRSPEASFSSGQIRILREAYGGDYQRLAPQTSEGFVTPPHQLGPLKHAQSVLSHRSDVSTGARINALNIISAAVGGATNARTTKAIVS